MESPNDNATFVSVIIPTRDRAHLVRRAIRSALDQTHAHVEVIVVDDASHDETREAVLGLNDARVHYLRHDIGRGGSAARNTGVRHAKGEVIAFLDDDDEWEPEKLAAQMRCLRDHDAVMCTARINGRDMAESHPRTYVDATILRRRMFPYGGIGVLAVRAAVLRDLPFDETLPKYQDWDLVIRLSAKCRIAYLNQALVRFNDGAHPRISNRFAQVPADELVHRYRGFFDKHAEFFGKRRIRSHLAGLLLYRFRYRADPMRHLRDTIRLCGPLAVGRALLKRAIQVVRERIRGSAAPVPAATPSVTDVSAREFAQPVRAGRK